MGVGRQGPRVCDLGPVGSEEVEGTTGTKRTFELKREVQWEVGSKCREAGAGASGREMAEAREQGPSGNCRELTVKPRRTSGGGADRKAGRRLGGRTGNVRPLGLRGEGASCEPLSYRTFFSVLCALRSYRRTQAWGCQGQAACLGSLAKCCTVFHIRMTP